MLTTMLIAEVHLVPRRQTKPNFKGVYHTKALVFGNRHWVFSIERIMAPQTAITQTLERQQRCKHTTTLR